MAIPPTVATIFIRIACCFAVMRMLAAAGWSSAAESPAWARMNFGYGAVVDYPGQRDFKKYGFDVKPLYPAGGLTSDKSSTRSFVSSSTTASLRAG